MQLAQQVCRLRCGLHKNRPCIDSCGLPVLPAVSELALCLLHLIFATTPCSHFSHSLYSGASRNGYKTHANKLHAACICISAILSRLSTALFSPRKSCAAAD